jgi:hypothetical protein
MRRRLLGSVLAALLLSPVRPAPAAGPPEEPDVVQRALQDELARTMERLRLAELERPYYVQYKVADVESKAVEASFGALVASNESRTRSLTADVRVGDYAFDNSNYLGQEGLTSFRPTVGTTALDEDYDAIRQDLWLLTDAAYKSALEQLAQKRGYVQGQRKPPEADDFSREEPTVWWRERVPLEAGPRRWEEEAKAISELCRSDATIEQCEVKVRLSARTDYFVTSEGTRLRRGQTLASFQARAVALAGDGVRVHQFVTVYAPTATALPPAEVLRQRVQEMLAQLAKQREAAELEQYTGPVLLEAPAAAQLLLALLAGELNGGRPAAGIMEMMPPGELRGRFQSKVLPEGMNLVDDPKQTAFGGAPLIGAYEVDDEGVPAQRVTLIENGVLKSWLMSRRPGKELKRSNGHGRAGLWGEAAAQPANLFLEAATPTPRAELEKRFLELCRAQNREFCLVVRRLDEPGLHSRDFRSLRALMSTMQRGGSPGVPALVVEKVYAADGRRERVRAGQLAGVRVRNLRDIVAAGDDSTVLNTRRTPAPAGGLFGMFSAMFDISGAGAEAGLPTSVVAPSLLFEELEFRKSPVEPEKVRLVPRPTALQP